MSGYFTMRPFTEDETRTEVNAIAFGQDGKAYIRIVPVGVFPADMKLTRVMVRDQNNQPHLVTVPVAFAAGCPRRAIYEPEEPAPEPPATLPGGKPALPGSTP